METTTIEEKIKTLILEEIKASAIDACDNPTDDNICKVLNAVEYLKKVFVAAPISTWQQSPSIPREPVWGDKSDTSLFYTENTGKTKYETKGFVNLKQLEFLSCDDFFERRAVKSPWVETENGMLNTAFRQRYGKVPYSLGIYTATASAFTKHIGEYGLHFSADFRKYLLAEFFKRLLSVNITRSGSFARVSEISVKPVYDGLKDTFESNDGWVGLSSEAEIGEFVESLDIYDFYEECDNDAKAAMDDLVTLETKKKEAKEAKKKDGNKKKTETKTEEVTNENGSFTL